MKAGEDAVMAQPTTVAEDRATSLFQDIVFSGGANHGDDYRSTATAPHNQSTGEMRASGLDRYAVAARASVLRSAPSTVCEIGPATSRTTPS